MKTFDFTSQISALLREVRDLKTAHERPLGSVSYYQTSGQWSLGSFSESYGIRHGTVIVESQAGSPIPTFLQIASTFVGKNSYQASPVGVKYSENRHRLACYFEFADGSESGVSASDTLRVVVTCGGVVTLSFATGWANP